MKIITHFNPDLDAVTSIWLLKRFFSGWHTAEVDFVKAEVIKEADLNPEVLYVDVGSGKLDHHQTGEYLSASAVVWKFVQKNRSGKPLRELDIKAVDRLIEVVTQIDNARDLVWPEVTENRYKFYLHTLIAGIRGLAGSDIEAVNFGLLALEAVFHNLKNKIRAEEEIKTGEKFLTVWGEAVAAETGNEEVLWEGEAEGYVLTMRKDPETGSVRIFARYDSKVDLTSLYNKVKELDPQSDWYLHTSKKMLLNQASVNPGMRPTKLSLETLISLLKKE